MMKTSSKLIRLSLVAGWLAVMAIVFAPQAAYAATCTSASNGNWNAISWSGCTPSSSDDVVIATTVTLDGDKQVRGLKIDSNASFSGSSNTLTVGYFENNGGTFNRNTGTVSFVATSGVTPGVYGSSSTIDFNNVTISTGVDFGNGKGVINGTLTINNGGSVTSSKAPTYASGSTLKYNTGASYTASEEWRPNTTTGAGVPHHVEIGNGTTLSFGSTNTARTMKGNLTIGGTLQLSTAIGGDLKIAGNWTNNGTFTHNAREVEFNGLGAQTINSTTTWDYLAINNSGSGVTLAAIQTVNTRLRFAAGLLKLGAYNLIMGSSAQAISPGAGSFSASMMVVADGTGSLCKQGTNTTDADYTFPIGDVSGPSNTAEYSPATLDFTAGSFSSAQACVRVTDAKHPNNTSTTDYLTRYWTVTQSGISSFSCSTTFTYLDADIAGTEGNIWTGKWNGTTWSRLNAANTGSNTIGGTATSFSDFTGGESAPMAVTMADFSAAQTGDAVLLTWETASELNNRGFNLYRGVDPSAPDRQLNDALIPSQSPGNPGGFIYTWEDRADLVAGTTYYYWVEDVDFNGVATRHGPVSVDYSVPTAVRVLDAGAVGTLPLALPFVGAGLLALAGLAARRRRS